MSFFNAILLGIIQGITEFLPISSSGHLIVAEQLLGMETDHGVLFNIILHLGTLTAILFAFRKDVIRLLYSYLGILHDIWKNLHIFVGNVIKKKEDTYRKILRTQYRKFAVLILIANIPTAVIGFLLRNFVENASNSVFVAGVGLLITGLLLFVSGFSKYGMKIPKNAVWQDGIIIGIIQGISVVPGISRFGTTMVGGKLRGFSKSFGLKFSFMISIPAILGAIILEIISLPGSTTDGLTFGFVLCCIVGAVFAAFAGVFAIRALISIVKKDKTRLFSYYCFIMGFFVLIINFMF